MAPVQAQGSRREILRAEIRTGAIPLAVVGVGSRSGNASAGFGLLPFDYGDKLLDEVVAELIGVPRPTASHLTMAAPEAGNHLMLGFYQLEQNQWRWIGPRALAVLRAPDSEGPAPFELSFHIPETAPARKVTVSLDGKMVASETYSGPGTYTLQGPVEVRAGSGTESEPVSEARPLVALSPGQTVTVEISVDQTFQAAGDSRDLGIVVTALGFGFRAGRSPAPP
jgi:hypothetical protein